MHGNHILSLQIHRFLFQILVLLSYGLNLLDKLLNLRANITFLIYEGYTS